MPFFEFCHDGVRTHVQYACGVANATGVHGHINDLLFDRRRLPWVTIVQQERATGTALLAASVPLLALTSLAMADDIGSLAVRTVQELENHEATRSRWGCPASETLIEESTSTPLRHLREDLYLTQDSSLQYGRQVSSHPWPTTV